MCIKLRYHDRSMYQYHMVAEWDKKAKAKLAHKYTITQSRHSFACQNVLRISLRATQCVRCVCVLRRLCKCSVRVQKY